MVIPLMLNEKKTVLDVDPTERLANILRREKLFSVKKGCTKGCCGSCTILLDGKPVPSCLLPVALAKDSSIITLEHFMKSADYSDIEKGFEKAGVHLCGYCNAGKIFTAWDIIQTYSRPKHEDLYEAVSHMTYCCTDRDTYINGILHAILFRNERMGINRNERK